MSLHSNGTSQSSVFVGAEEVIEAYRRGEIIILTDDEDRENEGDFIVAAEHATPEAINFMATHGRGLICVPITGQRATELALEPQARENTALLGTGFTVSVDAVENTTTGISAHDRAATIKTMIDPECRPEDLGRPGHIFPLVAVDGGVLSRPGHTEVVIDIARAAGMFPAGVLCEILNDDGTMARRPELEVVAKKFNLKISSVREFINYRYRTENLVEKVTEVGLPTEFGEFQLHLFKSLLDPTEIHTVLVKGELTSETPALVRVHSECFTGDSLGSHRCDCRHQLHYSMQKISEAGSGIVIYLRQEGRGIGLEHKLLAYKLQEEGHDTVEANEALGFDADMRNYWFAANVLRNLGVNQVRLMTNNPHKVADLNQYGLDVVERISIMADPSPSNAHYLQTKREKLGHLI